MGHIEDMKEKFADRGVNQFEDWWTRSGKFIDPDTDDVPWFDKRKGLGLAAFEAAMAISRNYVADDAVNPVQFTFANGRVVTIGDDGVLKIALKL